MTPLRGVAYRLYKYGPQEQKFGLSTELIPVKFLQKDRSKENFRYAKLISTTRKW